MKGTAEKWYGDHDIISGDDTRLDRAQEVCVWSQTKLKKQEV